MAEQIKDGFKGGTTLAGVDTEGRLTTRAVTEGEAVHAAEKGEAYSLNTGTITLTNAVETPLMYLKNNEDDDFVVEEVIIGVFDSTGGSSTAQVYATFIRNPTAGTIISNATNVSINSNRNFGSQKTLDANVYKGATGNTMTDGDDHVLVRLSAASRTIITLTEVLPKGSAIGFKFKPPTSNTSLGVYVEIVGYIHEDV